MCSGVLGSVAFFGFSSAVWRLIFYLLEHPNSASRKQAAGDSEEKEREKKKERRDGGLCGISLSDTDL